MILVDALGQETCMVQELAPSDRGTSQVWGCAAGGVFWRLFSDLGSRS
jgi:hypothetical protein